ncbi:E3 ubiquitin-protein ligase [Rhynchospora pubera]|uniref:RING-type E3 ubiquitin transferase n=1 Tax=Rhynchospora pubera TaxID=906938 RepID=A0AAV8EI23_9POAL|nr:E3 ubiquitin-protein ligase [Rhynchospora pubera]
MASSSSSSSSSSSTSLRVIDTTPLLSSSPGRTSGTPGTPSNGLRGAARFLRRAGSRRIMREPSVVVRDTAVEHIEERQSDWAYSKPVVVLDLLWNLMFVAVAGAMYVSSRHERPDMPLRVWVAGYVLQCVVHMVCVWLEYKRRTRIRDGSTGQDQEEDDKLSFAKHLESANTMFSFIWWIIGFYWISAGGQTLSTQAPQLYWLCIVFLAFDVFFVVFCVALACLVGIAVCCCLPCIIAILYAVRDQEGASEDDIRQLPKYKFRCSNVPEKVEAENGESLRGGIMTQCGTDPPMEQPLAAEDAECCICLCAYEDGAELRELPCGHHFHCSCIDKWLHLNATCPLCKSSIIKANSGEEV